MTSASRDASNYGTTVLIQRFRCQDKKGSFTAETTTWEGTTLAATPSELSTTEGHGKEYLDAVSQRAAKNAKSV
jgi:hypothetical protein